MTRPRYWPSLVGNTLQLEAARAARAGGDGLRKTAKALGTAKHTVSRDLQIAKVEVEQAASEVRYRGRELVKRAWVLGKHRRGE